MRWVTLTAGFILVAAAHGAPAQPSFDMPGRISATSYHELSLPGRITVVASDDNPVDVAVARRITDELARQGHAGTHPVAATLTFQTEVRREWHGGMTSARDSDPDPAGLPDLDERRHEGASVEAELPVGRLQLERQALHRPGLCTDSHPRYAADGPAALAVRDRLSRRDRHRRHGGIRRAGPASCREYRPQRPRRELPDRLTSAHGRPAATAGRDCGARCSLSSPRKRRIGAAMKIDDDVASTTPNSIVHANSRSASPP